MGCGRHVAPRPVDHAVPEGRPLPIALSTAPLSASDRSERWHEMVSRTFVPLDVRLLETEPSPGVISSEQLGLVQVSLVRAGPQTVTRSRRLIARDDQEFLILSLQHSGTAIKEQDGRESVINPGEFSISDSSRPFRKKLGGEFSFTSFHFPREELQVREEDLRALTATTFTGRTGSAAVVAAYFARMAQEARGFGDAVGRQFATTGLDLLALLIDERRGRFTPQAAETAAAAAVRVKDHIIRNLPDPGLSPATIAAANFMSVRYVHKLFQLEGETVGRWIQARRLERCRRDLLRSKGRDLGVAAVARRWGFVSPSHFGRVFRAAYGMTPREWQAHGLGTEGATGTKG
ncbi:helix-turn-helix domain-containing protein [Streptomyces sp. NPDC048231]|uniref:AraC-like ligand-binding domain-containing protein n=1 Tax=Streptomyces sp. NPDC048231 TaxID=3365519 RepID=UPI0037190978